jgi:ABC-2 type transport system permease protein
MTGSRATDRGAAGKLWLVAWHEYSRHVFRRRFIFVLLSVPFFLALMVGAGYLLVRLEMDTTAVGYVDHTGLLADPVPHVVENEKYAVPMLPFETEEDARSALQAKEIQAYYVLPPDYYETNEVRLVYVREPSENASIQFLEFLRVNWLAGRPEGVVQRIIDGPTVTYRAPDGSREFGAYPNLGNLLPLFLGLVFLVLVLSAAGYLMQAVVDEKENRTIEIVATSVSPGQLIAGKVFGIMAVGLTQFLAWTLFALLAVSIGGTSMGLGFFQDVAVDARALLAVVIEWGVAYVMVCALMTAAGVTVAEAEQAQQVAGLAFLPFLAPIWLIVPIFENPNGPLATGLSLFPTTAPLTISLRMVAGRVPLWELALSTAVLALCAWGSLWFAARAFRLGILRYGQRLRFREIFDRVRRSRGRLAGDSR